MRRSLNQTGRYVRKPSKDPKSNQLMEEHGVGYSSTGLVAQMREQDNLWKQGEVTVKLAKAYGYCWGVERAVRMAYEARNAFPDKRVHITNEIIHNPEVNQVGAHGIIILFGGRLRGRGGGAVPERAWARAAATSVKARAPGSRAPACRVSHGGAAGGRAWQQAAGGGLEHASSKQLCSAL